MLSVWHLCVNKCLACVWLYSIAKKEGFLDYALLCISSFHLGGHSQMSAFVMLESCDHEPIKMFLHVCVNSFVKKSMFSCMNFLFSRLALRKEFPFFSYMVLLILYVLLVWAYAVICDTAFFYVSHFVAIMLIFFLDIV